MARYCFLLQVRPELLDEYRERHTAVWPDMLTALQASGWRNYSIFARPDGRGPSKRDESFVLLEEIFNLDEQLARLSQHERG
jgi:L-rhamnose mutarotase